MSGFVLAYTLDRSDDGFKKYTLKRIFRLWPLHFFALISVVTIVANNHIHNKYVPQWFFHHEILSWFLNIFALTNIAVFDVEVFNDPSWSVSVELFVSIIILHYVAVRKNVILAFFIVIFSYAYLFYYDGLQLRSWSAVGHGINGGLLRGSGGVLIGYLLFVYKSVLPKFLILGWVSVPFLAWVLYASGDYLDVVGLLFFIVLLCHLQNDGGLRAVLQNSVFVWLGGISYSLYLMHTAVILLLAPSAWVGSLGHFAAFFVFGVSLVIAVVVTHGFENPSRNYLYKYFKLK